MRISIMIIMVSVGLIFAISINTTSIFQGSHYVTDVSGNGNDVNCTDCHTRIAQELYSNPDAPHYDLKCEDCHRYNGTGITFAVANSSGAFPGKQAHAAYVPKCLDCHGKGVWLINRFGQPAYAPPARAFNLTPVPYYTAHKQLFEYCKQLGDENLACLACHTNYSVNISYEYHYNLTYNIYFWNFKEFSPVWARSFKINVTKASLFSGKHLFIPLEDINCSSCHLNIYLGLINGTHSPIYSVWGSTNLWNDPRYHLISSNEINNTYCYQCHDLYLYIQRNPTANTTYGLSSAIPATNSTKVHCAEKVSCLTCHGYGKPYDPYDVIVTSGSNGTGHRILLNQTANYPRMYHGDICMGCHEASVHAVVSPCSDCHDYGAGKQGPSYYQLKFEIYSEPDGSASVKEVI